MPIISMLKVVKRPLIVVVALGTVCAAVMVWLSTCHSPTDQRQFRRNREPGVNFAYADPGGEHVALSVRPRDDNRPWDLIVVSLGDGNVRHVGSGRCLGWSTNGTRIVYRNLAQEGPRVIQFDMRHGTRQPLSWVPEGLLGWAWAPCRELVEISTFCGVERDADICLSVARPDGRSYRTLVRWPYLHWPDVTWGPECHYMYFTGWRVNSDTCEIARVEIDDARIETLVRGLVIGGLHLSSDGTRVVYMEDIPDRPRQLVRLWLLDTRNLKKTAILDPPFKLERGGFACSPAATSVAVTDVRGRLWRLRIPSGHAVLVAEQGYSPLWLPKPGQGFVYFRLASPDDRESDILMYHSNDLGTKQRLVARL